MAAPVSAGIGVVSAISGMSQQANQQAIASAQQKNQEKAARAQAMIDSLALRQQQDYARMQLDMQDSQYRAQDMQQRLQITEASAKETAAIKQAQDQSTAQLLDKQRQLKAAEFQVGEQRRQIEGQAQAASEQSGNQINQAAQQIEQALAQGNTQLALSIAAGAAQNMGQSTSAALGQIKGADKMLEQALTANQQLNSQSELTADQVAYMQRMGDLQSQAGFNELSAQEQAMLLQNQAQQRSLGFDQQLSDMGSGMATRALDAATAMRNQQGQTNRAFNQAGYNIQASNLNVQNASRLAEIQAQGAMARAQSGGGLLSGLAQVGGAISGLIPANTGGLTAGAKGAGQSQFSFGAPIPAFNQPIQDLGNFTGKTSSLGGNFR